MTEFGKWFAAQRISRRFFDQFAFAKASGVSRATIQSIEGGNGFANRHPRTQAKIADALKLDVMEIIRKEREMLGADLPPRIGKKTDTLRTVKMRASTAATFERLAKDNRKNLLDYFDWVAFYLSPDAGGPIKHGVVAPVEGGAPDGSDTRSPQTPQSPRARAPRKAQELSR